MCQDAKEIQKLKNKYQDSRNYNCHMEDNKIDFEYVNITNWNITVHPNKSPYVWLPTQAQLQEIYKEKYSDNKYIEECGQRWYWDMLREFNEMWHPTAPECSTTSNQWIRWSDKNVERYQYAKLFNSFEQLWLAFVMFEKYNKIWSKNKWIQSECK